MSYSSMLSQRASWLPLNSDATGGRGGTRKVVCCCPWSGSDTNKKDALLKANTSLKGIKSPEDGRRRLPPGPSPLHLIGLLHYLIRSPPYHHVLGDLANTYGPLLHVSLGELTMVLVSSARIAEEVLKTHDVVCANRPRTMANEVLSYGYTDLVTAPYGAYWKQARKISMTELLSTKNVRSSEHARREEGAILVERIRSRRGAPFDLTDEIAWFMNSVICRAVFGNVSIDRAAVIRSIRGIMASAGSIELADLFPSLEPLRHVAWKAPGVIREKQELEKVSDYIIEEHKKNRAATGKGYGDFGVEDFVDVLLRLQGSGDLQIPLSDDNIKAIVWNMVAGGTESASTAVDWTMAELVKNPRVMAKVQAEMRRGRRTIEEVDIRNLSYLKVVVKESMRLHPPNGILTRSCSQDLEIDGYHIPKNAAIIINIWRLARDPMYWHQPERFEPERFEGSSVDFVGNHYGYIPFGAGKRICPAIASAMANVEFLLAQLLYHFDWQLPPGVTAADMDMTEVGLAASRKTSLYLVATPYTPPRK